MVNVSKPTDETGLALEAWAQGYMVGSLIVMACVAVANMRRKVLLHKLIVIELLLGAFHGTFIFTNPPVYNWYLSATAVLLNISWTLHNVIAWMKNRPFLGRWWSRIYIASVFLAQPYWVLEIAANFLYFSSKSDLFVETRPWEALFRDPWWIFTVLNLFWNIKSKYEFGYIELVRVSPRFGVLLGSMIVSVCFIILDILAVTRVISSSGMPDGINPFWKLAYVFKCLTDTIILDDFKTALDRLQQYKLGRISTVLSDVVRADFPCTGQVQEKKASRLSNEDSASHDSVVFHACDWSNLQQSDRLDLEAALRMDSGQPGRSSRPSKG